MLEYPQEFSESIASWYQCFVLMCQYVQQKILKIYKYMKEKFTFGVCIGNIELPFCVEEYK